MTERMNMIMQVKNHPARKGECRPRDLKGKLDPWAEAAEIVPEPAAEDNQRTAEAEGHLLIKNKQLRHMCDEGLKGPLWP